MNNGFDNNNSFEHSNGFEGNDTYKAEDAKPAGANGQDQETTFDGAYVDNAVNFIMSNTDGGKEESESASAESKTSAVLGSKPSESAGDASPGSGLSQDGTYRYTYSHNPHPDNDKVYGGNAYGSNSYNGNAYGGNAYKGNSYGGNSYAGGGEQNRHYTYQSQQSHQTPPGAPPKPGKAKKARKSRPGLKKVLACAGLALVFGVVASVGFQITNFVGDKLNPENGTVESVPQVSQSTGSAMETSSGADGMTDVSSVTSAVMPSVVSITSVSDQEIQSFFGSQIQESESSGTGIIVGQNDTELLIATNNHVVADAKTLTVVFNDEETAKATLKGNDSAKDLAVIAVKKKNIPEDTMKSIKVATLGDSSSLKVGEPVIAIGNALGYGQSVTTGIISALDREVSINDVASKLIQTDAAINAGNSGGPLLNSKGEVIGINEAKIAGSGVEAMGYAIPISDATPILNNLMTKTTREKVAEGKQGFLGIQGANVTQEFSEVYGFPTGAYVSQVTDDSAAEEAGMERGDIITAFDGTTIDSMETLQSTLQYYKAGEKVKVTVQRPGDGGEYEEKTLTVKLGKRPTEDE